MNSKLPTRLLLVASLFAVVPLHAGNPVEGKNWHFISTGSRGGAGQGTALCYDGSLHIAHISGSHAVVHRYMSGGNLYPAQLVDAAGATGQNLSVATGLYGVTHIAYYNSSAGELRHAWHSGSTWQHEVVDNIGTYVGYFPSIQLDTQGGIHIAYFDAGSGHLRYAYKTSTYAPWQKFVVDADPKVGYHASLALDSNGQPRIAYYDLTHQRLKYAALQAGSWWQLSVVDDTANVGQYCSLAIDYDGRPHISYRDVTHHSLKYATTNRSGWSQKTLDVSPHVGEYSAITALYKHVPLIAYYDAYESELKIADTLGNTAVVDAGPLVGKFCTITRSSSNGDVCIAYWDEFNDELKIAYTSDY